MSRFQVTRPLVQRLKDLVPLGILHRKPRHFTNMLQVMWKNRDNPWYAWKVVSRGVCDGCALGVAGLHDWTIKGTHLCMTRLNLLRLNTMPEMDHALLSDTDALKGRENAELRELGRLAYPMVRRKGEKGFTRITWDEAYRRMAARIRATAPSRMAFFVTARGVTNEVYYLAQKAARALGTNNVDNAARICHSPSTGAMKQALGVSASTCSYSDWYGTDLIVFWGSNPANDQPVTTKYLHEAKGLGTKVAIVNPYLEPGMQRYWVPSTPSSALFGTAIADYFVPVNTGGDIAFIYGVIRHLVTEGWCDDAFIREHTEGYENLKKTALNLEWEALERQSGIDREGMKDFARLLKEARNAVFVWSMGITQHHFGGDAVRMVLNLGLLRGYVGREKTGLMPIRGHSSVQGGAEMGCYATAFPGTTPVNPENARALSEAYGFKVPDWQGMTTVDMVESAARGELDFFYLLGGNLLRNLPDPEHVSQALAKVPFRVHQDIIINDQMLIEPGEEVLLLPAQTRYEQTDGGIETTTERRICFSPEIPRQVGEARAEWIILRDLVRTVKPELTEVFGCEDGWKVREEIARVVPFYAGVQHLRKTGDMVQYGGTRLCDGGKFHTPDGKAHLIPVGLPELSRPAGKFKASTRRGKQFNSLVYAEIDPLNGAPRDAILMNPEDAGELHLKQGDKVWLKNERGVFEGSIFLANIAPGNLQVHWPEGNIIIPRGVLDSSSGVPDYNVVVEVVRLTGKEQPAFSI